MSLNPLVDASDPAVVDVGHLLYRSLLKLDSTGYPTTDLAASYGVSTNGLVYTVVLRPNLEWSNGTPITTADVVATVSFALSPQASDATLLTALQGVTVAAHPSTVTFTLAAPRASFAATLTQLPILPLGALTATQVEEAGAHPTTPMPTSGIYDVQSAAALMLILQPNPHSAARPLITSYELRLFLTFADAAGAFSQGSINALLASTPEELSTLMAVKGAQAESMTTPDFVDLMFNERVPALANSVVRHAIGIAINRSSLVTGALGGSGGEIQTSPFSAGIPWVGPPAIEAISPSVAESVLQANGWVPGPNGVRANGPTQLAFTLAVPDINPLPVVAREVASQLAVIGVQVTVDPVPAQTFLPGTLESGHFQLAIEFLESDPGSRRERFLAVQRQPAARLQRVGRHSRPIPRRRPGHARRVIGEGGSRQRGRAGRRADRGRRPGGVSLHAEDLRRLPVTRADCADTGPRPGVRPLRRHRVLGDPLGVGTAGRRCYYRRAPGRGGGTGRHAAFRALCS